MSNKALVKHWMVWWCRTRLRKSSACLSFWIPDLYKMWNFSRLRFLLQILRMQKQLSIQDQHVSPKAWEVVKTNLLYFLRCWLIKTLTTSDLVSLCSYFVIILLSRFSISLWCFSPTLSISLRLFLTKVTVRIARVMTGFCGLKSWPRLLKADWAMSGIFCDCALFSESAWLDLLPVIKFCSVVNCSSFRIWSFWYWFVLTSLFKFSSKFGVGAAVRPTELWGERAWPELWF